MPTMAQLGKLASQLYVGNPNIGADEQKYNIQFDSNSSTAQALGLTLPFAFWSNKEFNANGAYARTFNTTKSEWYSYYGRFGSSPVICLGD